MRHSETTDTVFRQAPATWVKYLLLVLLAEKTIQHLTVTAAFAFNWADIRSTVVVNPALLMISGAMVALLFAVSLWGMMRQVKGVIDLVIALSLFDIVGEFVAQGTMSITMTVSFLAAILLLVLALFERRQELRIAQEQPTSRQLGRRWLPQLSALLEVSMVLLATMASTFALRTTPFAQSQGPLLLNLLGHLAFVLVPVLWLLATRRDLAAYGLVFTHLRSDWQTAMTVYLPIALGAATLGFIDYKAWPGAFLQAGVELVVLLIVARTLTSKLDAKPGYLTIGLAILLLGGYSFWRGTLPGVRFMGLALLTYVPGVGLGEELLYRGYIQSRLNQVFGRPWHFYGVDWGWGVVLTAFLFGLTHTGIFALLFGQTQFAALTWPWGLWTFVGSFVLSYVREKTGSIAAPVLLHGLPQAIAVAMLGG